MVPEFCPGGSGPHKIAGIRRAGKGKYVDFSLDMMHRSVKNHVPQDFPRNLLREFAGEVRHARAFGLPSPGRLSLG